ncbi:MAG: outer membrane protein [Allosphingosinicella sp.]
MKKTALLLLTAATAAVLASPAAAAPATGGRVEAVLGYDRPSLDLEDFGFDADLNRSGVVFGVGVGYDFAVGPGASLGIDLEASESTADFNFAEAGDSAELNIGRDLYAGARLTFPVSPAANMYLKAGYTNLRVGATIVEDGDIFSDSANADGLRAGIGAQFMLGTSAYLGGEYRYSNYEADLSRHQAVATLGFRF